MRSFALLWALMLCQGCQYRYWVEEQRYGVFVDRDYWEEHKRTYETGVRYSELCNTVTEDCYRHGGQATSRVRYSVGYYTLRNGVIAISFNNRNGDIFEEKHLEMFRTADGERLPCENCAGGFERSVDGFGIAETSSFVTARANFRVGDKILDRIYMLDIGKDSYRIELVEERDLKDRKAYSLLHYKGPSIYWIDCRADCQFVRLDMESKEREVRPAPECQGKKKIEVHREKSDLDPKPLCYNEDWEVWCATDACRSSMERLSEER